MELWSISVAGPTKKDFNVYVLLSFPCSNHSIRIELKLPSSISKKETSSINNNIPQKKKLWQQNPIPLMANQSSSSSSSSSSYPILCASFNQDARYLHQYSLFLSFHFYSLPALGFLISGNSFSRENKIEFYWNKRIILIGSICKRIDWLIFILIFLTFGFSEFAVALWLGQGMVSKSLTRIQEDSVMNEVSFPINTLSWFQSLLLYMSIYLFL